MAKNKLSKSQFVAAVADKTGLSKKQASAALEAMIDIVVSQLGKKGPGEVIIPGLLKLLVQVKPAVPERNGINPFTKEPTVFKAKPARQVVKARPVKALKDAV
ncbi:MAG: HU family DNA-binding protein [Anaerolineales bacterium]